MKRNLGRTERIIRVVIGVAALASWYFGAVAGTVGIVTGVVAIMLLGTSAAAHCPLHQAVGINSLSKGGVSEMASTTKSKTPIKRIDSGVGAVVISVLAIGCQFQSPPPVGEGPGLGYAQVIEVTEFSLTEGTDHAAFISDVQRLNDSFFAAQPGFIHRSLTQANDTLWADVIFWESEAALEQAIRHAETDSAAVAFFRRIDPARVHMQRYRIVDLFAGRRNNRKSKPISL